MEYDPKRKTTDDEESKKRKDDEQVDFPVRITTSGNLSVNIPGSPLGIDLSDGSLTFNVPGTPISIDTGGN